jgi:hypothetical protein
LEIWDAITCDLHNNKNNMEHPNTKKKMKTKDTIQIAWLILLFILIGALLFSVIKLSKNIDVLKENPIDYGIKNSDITYCRCYDFSGKVYNFPELKQNEGVISGSG